MRESVNVSEVSTFEAVKQRIQEFLEQGRYDDISRAIGMHSVMMDPEHTLGDQARLYQVVLQLIKNRISAANPKLYSGWLVAFPKQLAGLVERKEIVTDEAALNVLASRQGAFGPFDSVDEFFFWSLDDRRLPLNQIIRYIEKTVELQEKGA